jgi:ferredoxin
VNHRLRIDWIRCDGYGLCGDLVPDVIELDEWRYPILPSDPIDALRLHDVQRAVDCCPVRALRLERAVEADRRRPRPGVRP